MARGLPRVAIITASSHFSGGGKEWGGKGGSTPGVTVQGVAFGGAKIWNFEISQSTLMPSL